MILTIIHQRNHQVLGRYELNVEQLTILSTNHHLWLNNGSFIIEQFNFDIGSNGNYTAFVSPVARLSESVSIDEMEEVIARRY